MMTGLYEPGTRHFFFSKKKVSIKESRAQGWAKL